MSALTQAALLCSWGMRQDQEGRNTPDAHELRKLCQAMAEENVLCSQPLVLASLGLAPLPGLWLCPASALCLAVPWEENGCACGSWLCGLFCCGLGLCWQCSWTMPWLQGDQDRNGGSDSAVPNNCGSHCWEGS